jgi:hypothetical protein
MGKAEFERKLLRGGLLLIEMETWRLCDSPSRSTKTYAKLRSVETELKLGRRAVKITSHRANESLPGQVGIDLTREVATNPGKDYSQERRSAEHTLPGGRLKI